MNEGILSLVVILGFMGVVAMVKRRMKKLPPDVVEAVSNGSITLVDVREKAELAGGTIKGSLNIPTSLFSEDPEKVKKMLKHIPKEKEIWVYCRSGGRAGQVAQALNSLGYQARNIGGFDDAVAAGLPTK